MVYLSLFIVAFIAATIFPLSSEALFLYNVLSGYNFYALLFVASLGNTLGSCVNYFLGQKGESYLSAKKYLTQKSIDKYTQLFKRYGIILLLLSWLPIVGDGFTFVAGLLKYKFKYFLVIVFLAKFCRYLFLVIFLDLENILISTSN